MGGEEEGGGAREPAGEAGAGEEDAKARGEAAAAAAAPTARTIEYSWRRIVVNAPKVEESNTHVAIVDCS